MKIKNTTPFASMALPMVDDDGDPMLSVITKGTFDIVNDNVARISDTHPEHPRLSFRLPGVLIAAGLVHASGFRHGSPARLDTVFIDADALKLELTWRASFPLFREPIASVHIAMRGMQ